MVVVVVVVVVLEVIVAAVATNHANSYVMQKVPPQIDTLPAATEIPFFILRKPNSLL